MNKLPWFVFRYVVFFCFFFLRIVFVYAVSVFSIASQRVICLLQMPFDHVLIFVKKTSCLSVCLSKLKVNSFHTFNWINHNEMWLPAHHGMNRQIFAFVSNVSSKMLSPHSQHTHTHTFQTLKFLFNIDLLLFHLCEFYMSILNNSLSIACRPGIFFVNHTHFSVFLSFNCLSLSVSIDFYLIWCGFLLGMLCTLRVFIFFLFKVCSNFLFFFFTWIYFNCMEFWYATAKLEWIPSNLKLS